MPLHFSNRSVTIYYSEICMQSNRFFLKNQLNKALQFLPALMLPTTIHAINFSN